MSKDLNGSWLSTLREGGVPQVLLGPAGAAISRLLGSAIEIPSSYLDGLSQHIKDKNEAKSRLHRALADKAIESALLDDDLIQRALDSILKREIRREQNKIGVAKAAIKELSDNPPPSGGEEPTEQFMTKFERLAEDAVEPDIRELFGKLLASEIRESKSVSASTLNFVSLLDSESAQRINAVLPACLRDIAIIDAIEPNLNVAGLTYLEQIGFWTWQRSLSLTFDQDGKILKTPRNDFGLVAFGESGRTIRFDIAIISKEGMELIKALNPPFDFEAMANLFKKHGATKFYSGRARYFGDQVSVSLDTRHF